MLSFAARLDEWPRPIWFALAFAAFMIWWPLGLALLRAAFPPEKRGAAIGIFSAITGIAVASGPLLGGAVVQGQCGRRCGRDGVAERQLTAPADRGDRGVALPSVRGEGESDVDGGEAGADQQHRLVRRDLVESTRGPGVADVVRMSRADAHRPGGVRGRRVAGGQHHVVGAEGVATRQRDGADSLDARGRVVHREGDR